MKFSAESWGLFCEKKINDYQSRIPEWKRLRETRKLRDGLRNCRRDMFERQFSNSPAIKELTKEINKLNIAFILYS